MAKNEADNVLFEVSTPLGFSVRSTASYWMTIVRMKHPIMKGRRDDVISALRDPDQVHVSQSDSAVFLFYRKEKASRWVCAVAKRLNGKWLSHHDLPHRRHQRRQTGMAQVKVFHDRRGNTLTVWFDDPQQEYSCEETGDEIVLMKNRAGHVIGFEKLNYSASDNEPFEVTFSASERE